MPSSVVISENAASRMYEWPSSSGPATRAMFLWPNKARCRIIVPDAEASSLINVGRPLVSDESASARHGICGLFFISSMRGSPISRLSSSSASTLPVAIQSSRIETSSSSSIDMRTSSE